ncbi:MAG: hypothetical protein KDA58_08530, partial [Planctomycetaceae bacterium]|nr:hypothetical protein [Planctomycetaceae bacterium]
AHGISEGSTNRKDLRGSPSRTHAVDHSCVLQQSAPTCLLDGLILVRAYPPKKAMVLGTLYHQ